LLRTFSTRRIDGHSDCFVLAAELDDLALYQLLGITRGEAPHDVEALDCHDSFIVVPLLHLV